MKCASPLPSSTPSPSSAIVDFPVGHVLDSDQILGRVETSDGRRVSARVPTPSWRDVRHPIMPWFLFTCR